MKQLFTLLTGLFSIYYSYSQVITANDSVNTLPGNTQMVFYSLATGTKTNVSNTDWHLAVSVRPTQFPNNTLGGTTVRINEANGVVVYQIPNYTQDSAWNVVDTTGYHNWTKLHDADTVLNDGAFNAGYNISNVFYGWGQYTGAPFHNVAGRRVYLVELPNGAVKKVFINKLVFDTAWVISYTNIDNSDSLGFYVDKTQYTGKNLVYLNLIDNTVLDKEPMATDWDLQFLKYDARDVIPGDVYPVTGTWLNTNTGTTAAKVTGISPQDNYYYSYPFSPLLNSVGYDWKVFNGGSGTYDIVDSLSYFVQTRSAQVYKVIFTAYGGSTTGVISFYKEMVGSATGVNEANAENNMAVYPNPANSQLVVASAQPLKDISVFNLVGEKVAYMPAGNQNSLSLNIASLSAGAYVLNIQSVDGKVSYRKFLVAR